MPTTPHCMQVLLVNFTLQRGSRAKDQQILTYFGQSVDELK